MSATGKGSGFPAFWLTFTVMGLTYGTILLSVIGVCTLNAWNRSLRCGF
jgi:hypothetical protein